MVLFAGTVGCIFVMKGLGAAGERAAQSNVEARYAQKLCSAIGLARAVNQGIMPTNIIQVQPSLTMEGWAMWENVFRQFGDEAGFSNSIFEKYVFLPPGLKVPVGRVSVDGISMNAKIFLDDQGRAYRWIIYHYGDEIDCGPFAEEKVQEMLLQAGIKVPKPPPMVSAVELDAPRRQEETQRQQEMEEEIEYKWRENIDRAIENGETQSILPVIAELFYELIKGKHKPSDTEALYRSLREMKKINERVNAQHKE